MKKHFPQWPVESFFDKGVQKQMQLHFKPVPFSKKEGKISWNLECNAWPIRAFIALDDLATADRPNPDAIQYFHVHPEFSTKVFMALVNYYERPKTKMADAIVGQLWRRSSTDDEETMRSGKLVLRKPEKWDALDFSTIVKGQRANVKGEHVRTRHYPREIKRRISILKKWKDNLSAWERNTNWP